MGRRTTALAIAASLLALGATSAGARAPGTAAPPSLAADATQNGIAFPAWWSGVYPTAASMQSLDNLASTGATWVQVVVTAYQDTHTSTAISFTGPATPSHADVTAVVQRAHALGLKVMLKPHVDLANDPSHWRGQIGDGFTQAPQWKAWFASYRRFINDQATLAQQLGVDQFSVGCELEGTSSRMKNWRSVVSQVRARYTGPITYASNAGGEESTIRWWDAVDVIGVDAYYELTTTSNPTVAQLEAAWAPIVSSLSALSSRWGKTILFTEIGYRSVDGANMHPWDWQSSGQVDLQEQADCYTALFHAVYGQPWFGGLYLWMWDTDPSAGGPTDDGYTPWQKPAGDVLTATY